jgi:hypothetical protein
MDGGRTGTSNAYEANNATGLTGKIAKLYYESISDDWRFQFVRTGDPLSPPVGCRFCVTAANVCTGFVITSGATVTLKQGGVTVATCTTTGQVASVTVTAAGSGYTTAALLTFTGGGGSGAVAASRLKVVGFTVTAGGTNYTTLPTVTISGGSGSGATGSARLRVKSLNLTSGGAGYTNGVGYALGFSGGLGAGAAGTFDVVGGAVTNLVLTSPGTGFFSPPAVSFPGAGGGAGAAATAVMEVYAIVVTGAGSGFRSVPGVTLAGGGGSGATATALMGIGSVVMIDGGAGYTSAPTIGFGGGGAGATATAVLNTQCCFSGVPDGSGYTVTVAASGYVTQTTAPFSIPGSCFNRNFSLDPDTGTVSGKNVWGCTTGTGFAGIQVTAAQTGGSTQSTTVLADGKFSFAAPFQTYNGTNPIVFTYHDPEGRFQDRTCTVTGHTPCSNVEIDCNVFVSSVCSAETGLVQGDVEADYVCLPTGSGCNYPVKKVLIYSDPVIGSVTLNFVPCDESDDGFNHWIGTTTYEFGGCTPLSFCTPPETLTCPAVSVPITVRWDGGNNVNITWPTNHDVHCAGHPELFIECPGTGTVADSGGVTIFVDSFDCPPAMLWTGSTPDLGTPLCGFYTGIVEGSITE